MRWLGPYLSKGNDSKSVSPPRHADTKTMDYLIHLQNKVRVYEQALLTIYWETSEPFINNVAHKALEDAKGDSK